MIRELYKGLDGFFSWPHLYEDMVAKFPSGSTLVEVGNYKGKSLAYLILVASESKKTFDIVGVDNFSGVKDHSGGNSLRNEFYSRMAVVSDKFRMIESLSWDAPAEFAYKSVDFVFIDADHSYECVLRDIQAWLPKVKDGGVIAGHDYHIGFPSVDDAVDEIFGENISLKYEVEQCWYVQL